MKPNLIPFLLALFVATTHAEDLEANDSSTRLSHAQVDEIRARIKSLQARQAELQQKIADGETTPNADLKAAWPKIQEQVLSLRDSIAALNTLSAESPERPALEGKLLGSLQPIGIHLDVASHPDFTPRTLDAAQIAEMDRIGKAIEGMKFGDRATASPVKLLSPDPCFTLIHLPVPIVLQCGPGDTVYLVATTGGAFHNGLSLIELQADAEGIAQTTWVSIGDAVADCDIAVHSQAAIETQGLRIKVVSPSLPVLEGVPQPEHLKGEIPRLKSKITAAKSTIPNP